MASTQHIAAASARSSLRSRARRTGYVCLSCQLHALSISSKPLSPSRSRNIALTHARHYASQRPSDDGFESSFADKLRKKMWGTDRPPGQRNPYVKESPEDEEDRLREEADREAREIEEAEFARIRDGETDENAVLGEQDAVDDVAEEDKEEDEGGKEKQDRGYKPATTWRGLRFIPGWKVAQQKPKPWFEGFLASDKVETTDGIERAIQRALVEVWSVKQELGTTDLPKKIANPTDDFEERLAIGATFNSDMSLVFSDETLQEDVARSLGLRHDKEAIIEKEEEKFDHLSEDMFVGERFGRRAPRRKEVEISPSQSLDEGETVDDPAGGVEEDVIAIGEPEVTGASKKPLSPVDQSYQQVAFQEPDVKFAVLKRVMQLIGTRIPDPAIPRLNTAASLFKFLIKPPPAKHLIDDLRENAVLQSLPNLQVLGQRFTMKDKEIEIGRWKLIEAELAKRGVPSEAEMTTMEKEMGKVDDHVLPLVRQKEKALRRRR